MWLLAAWVLPGLLSYVLWVSASKAAYPRMYGEDSLLVHLMAIGLSITGPISLVLLLWVAIEHLRSVRRTPIHTQTRPPSQSRPQ